MKRRELLSRAFLLTVSSIIGGGYLRDESSKAAFKSGISRLYPYHPTSSIYLLPAHPVIYETFDILSVVTTDLPLKIVSPGEVININSSELLINEEGTYEFQYLGPEYGWRVT